MTEFSQTDRRALVSVATQFFVNGALFASFLPRLPEIRDRVGSTVDRVGLLLAMAGLVGLVGSALVGPMVSRFGTRKVLIVSATVVSASLPLIGVAESETALLFGLIAVLSLDVLVDSTMNLQGSWLSARRHAPVMSRLHGLWSLGTVVGGVISSRLAASGVSLPTHLFVASALLLATVVFVGRGLLRVDERHQDDEGPAGSGSSGPTRARRSTLWLLAAAGMSAVAVEATSVDWSAFRFADDHGLSPGRAGLAYVAVTVGMTAGRFAGDWAAVRFGPDRLQAGANVSTFAGLAVATLVDHPAADLAGFAVAGVGIATMLPAIYDRAARYPGRAGAGIGALTAGLRLAGLTVPATVGALAGTSLSVGSAMAVVALPGVLGFALVGRTLSKR